MDVASNVSPLIHRRALPLHAVLTFTLLFVPGATPGVLLFGACFAAGFLIERYRRQLERDVRLTVKQNDDILFRGERSPFLLEIGNVEALNGMMRSAYVRIKTDDRFSVYHEQEKKTLHEFKELAHRLRFEIEGHERGPVRLPEIALSLDLPLRLGQLVLTSPADAEWTVYPSIDRAQAQVVKNILDLGERKVLHSPLKDRSLQISSAPYRNEPSRQIDWYATAKMASLQSKVYQPSMQDTFTLVLDLSSPSGIALHRQFETLIENTALAARELIASDGKIEVFINRLDENGRLTHLKIKDGPRQLKRLLILLADLSESDLFVGTSRFSTYVDRMKQKQSQRVDIRVFN
ncbi:DUF58 domain-containing protein [Exiguobacterium flavidum]|uniref:DUF58 domain-containing protein n=1 Tax=Exiguobacterium flavidum TaxID=2184695 RepID=UPI000DF778C3|nr:DUF58 domain-containing protein [Exiguobacterium flavidum]